MRAGRIDRLITLQQRIETQDTYGEPIIAWKPLVKVADHLFLTEDENHLLATEDGDLLVMDATLATGTLTIGVRYQITATETDHFGAGLEVYDVFVATATTALNADNKVKPVTLQAEVWAERKELKGDERWTAQQVLDQIECKYKIRYRDDVTALCGLTDGSDEFDIHAALELGRKDGLELIVSTREN